MNCPACGILLPRPVTKLAESLGMRGTICQTCLGDATHGRMVQFNIKIEPELEHELRETARRRGIPISRLARARLWRNDGEAQ